MTIDEIRASANSARSRPATRNTARPRRRDHDRAARPGPRQRRRHGARGAHLAARFGSAGRSPDLGARQRRRPDGRHRQEAIALAGHLKLGKLIVLYDDNGISIDGPTSLSEFGRPGASASRPTAGRRRASTGTTRAGRGGARRRAANRQADAHRLPHDDRPRRPNQGRDRAGRTAHRSARRGRRRASKARLDRAAFQDSRRATRQMARRGRARARGARGCERLAASMRQASRVRTAHGGELPETGTTRIAA